MNKQSTLVTFPSKPTYLPVKCSKNNASIKEESLQKLVENKFPSLFKPFYPVWWLCNQLLEITDGGIIGLDFAPLNFGEMAGDIPILVVAHGLTGGSYESYLRAIVKPAVTPVNEGGLGFRAVVITYRGCAGVPLTSPKLYSAGHMDDFRLCVAYIQHTWLGGGDSRLCSAVVLLCPWNLKTNGDALMKSFLRKQIYSRGMGTNLQSIVRKHEKVLRRFPENAIYKELDATLALRAPMLYIFDDTFTRKVCGEQPLFPMSTSDHYYKWASTSHLIGGIKVPYISLNSEDDPVVTTVPMDGGGNGLVVMALTKCGGHLGWFESVTWSQRERWTTKPVLEWLKLMGEDVLPQNTSIQVTLTYKDNDGFIRVQRKDKVGCREIDGGGLIDGARVRF